MTAGTRQATYAHSMGRGQQSSDQAAVHPLDRRRSKRPLDLVPTALLSRHSKTVWALTTVLADNNWDRHDIPTAAPLFYKHIDDLEWGVRRAGLLNFLIECERAADPMRRHAGQRAVSQMIWALAHAPAAERPIMDVGEEASPETVRPQIAWLLDFFRRHHGEDIEVLRWARSLDVPI
jgi:hypothetical protein